MSEQNRELTLDEIDLVAGGDDSFSLQQALAAQQQATQAGCECVQEQSRHDHGHPPQGARLIGIEIIRQLAG